MFKSSFRCFTQLFLLFTVGFVFNAGAFAQGSGGSVSGMAPSLDKCSPSPVSNCKESGGNNRPSGAGEQGFAADNHTPVNKPGSEKLGTVNGPIPGHAGQELGQPVQSGGPEQHSEKNQKGQAVKPMKGVEAGTATPITLTSAFGTKTDYEPALALSPGAGGPNSTGHDRGAWGDVLAPAGLQAGETGQGENGPNMMNSQTVGNTSQVAAILAADADAMVQQATNPRGWSKVAKGVQQAQNMQNSDNQGNCARQNCQNSFTLMKLPLINVANEEAGMPCLSDQPFKIESNVVWMVQQMYKKCYVPMAVLFLLPGAVLTQLKSLVSFSILNTQDEDTASPFVGIFRSMMAIFLIPATQLVVSYCIDIGNALTAPVAERVQVEVLMDWVMEQAYASDPKNNDGTLKNVAANMGKLQGTSVKTLVQERQNDLNVTIQNTLNTVNALLSQGLEILNGFQLVMMCYLFLLGPIAAAFFAWPSAVGNSLFKKAFASWLDGVIVLSLWKFWWCIVLLCMVVRLQSGGIDATSQYEMYYYTAFMTILVWVPFQPFEFRPGDMVDKVLERAQGGGGGGGGAGSGGGKGGGACGQGGNSGANASSVGGASSGTAGQRSVGQANPGMQGEAGPGGGKANAGGSESEKSAKDNRSMHTETQAADPIDNSRITMNDTLPPPPQA